MLVALAIAYYIALVKQPPQLPVLHAITFFAEATALFPQANATAIEARLESWSCARKTWEPRDPRPLFPIEAESKESRFQRIAYFYPRNRTVMRALDEWITERTPGSGGIRIAKLLRPIPDVGADVPRYAYHPLDAIDPAERHDVYYTPSNLRATRCRH